VTNSERRISRVRAAVAPPAEARADWRIAAEVARRLEARLRPGRPGLFAWPDAESVWLEHRATTRGRDLDITGLDYARLEARPAQWPCPEGASEGRARLYADRRFATPDGRARFVAVEPQPLAEPRDARYPFSLTTGRLRDQWHGMSRSGTIARAFGHEAEPAVELNGADMARLALAEGELVHVTSRRGSIVLPARPSEKLAPAQAFIAMHWGDEWLSGRTGRGGRAAGVNALTVAAYCPRSKQPELKHAAVKVLKAELPWRLLALAWLPDAARALAARAALAALLPRFEFASCVPFGRERSGVLLRAAAHEAADDALLEAIEAELGLGGREVLRYADRRRGQRRSLRLDGHGTTARLEAVLLAGDASAEAWVKRLLQEERPAEGQGRLLLRPGARAPQASAAARGRTVCACLDLTEPEIEARLAGCAGDEIARLAALQASARCGTQCGSCLPELRRLARRSAAVVA